MFDIAGEARALPPPGMIFSELPPFDPIYYMIHIAGAPPDTSARPAFNSNPALDDLTWDSLPEEVRKVSFSLIPQIWCVLSFGFNSARFVIT